MFNKNLANVRFVKIRTLPAVREHLTQKFYVENALDESSSLGVHLDEKINIDEQDSIILNSALTTPKTVIKLPTTLFFYSLSENGRN